MPKRKTPYRSKVKIGVGPDGKPINKWIQGRTRAELQAAREAVIAKYAKAIEAKSQELARETEKLSKVPLTEQLGDEAKKIRANMAGLTESLDKLKANMEAYTDGLKAKK